METKFGKILFAKRRRELIPIWMKPFIFLFLIFGFLGIFGIGKKYNGIVK